MPRAPLIVHQLVPRGQLQGFGNAPEAKSKVARKPVLPAEAKRAIQMIRERPELAERFLFLCEVSDRAPERIHNACAAGQRLMPLLAGHEVEHVGVLFLDSGTRVIAAEVLAKGGRSSAIVDASVVLRRAIMLRANSIILGHNHPSGEREPSNDDIRITRQLKTASESIGIRLLDHLIIAGTQFTSLAESGRM